MNGLVLPVTGAAKDGEELYTHTSLLHASKQSGLQKSVMSTELKNALTCRLHSTPNPPTPRVFVHCCAEDSVYDTPIDPFFVALRVLRVAGDHIKLRQPQQLSHTAFFPTDPNIGPNLMHTALCRESGSSVVGSDSSELYDWDSLSMREGHAEGPHV